MIHKYNCRSFCEEFDFTQKDLEIVFNPSHPIIKFEGWRDLNSKQILVMIRDRAFVVPVEEVEHLKLIFKLALDKRLYFYRMVSTQLTEFRSYLESEFERANTRDLNIQEQLMELNERFELDEAKIDSKYFCEVTGYAPQTFRNNMDTIDNKNLIGRLDIEIYKNLVWHKIKNRWKTSLKEFLGLRASISYENGLEERKRKDEYVRPKINNKEILEKKKDKYDEFVLLAEDEYKKTKRKDKK